MTNNLFYSVISIDSKKVPISFIPSTPFIFNCDFSRENIRLTQTNQSLEKEVVINYDEIINVELTVCSRLRGAPISMLPTMFYNFNLCISTNTKKYNIEFQINYAFKEVIEIFKEKNIEFNDVLKIFDMFKQEQVFNEESYNYLNDNFKDLAKEYNLEYLRFGYN